MLTSDAIRAIDAVPAGAWAVGVSGGSDSVALLELLRARSDLTLHIVHLNHQARGRASDDDAAFVSQIAERCRLPITIARLEDLERDGPSPSTNKSARFRAARHRLFRSVVQTHGLHGVILAHHADDQAETVLQRLLRGSGPRGLAGMSRRTVIGLLTVLRPLLGTAKSSLRDLLTERGVAWREDASNQSPNQQRNRVRLLLRQHPHLAPLLISVADNCRAMNDWLRDAAPRLSESFAVPLLADLPAPVARESARRWLADHFAARADRHASISPAAIDRLIAMAADAASPARQNFPGDLLVRRKSGIISVTAASAPLSNASISVRESRR